MNSDVASDFALGLIFFLFGAMFVAMFTGVTQPPCREKVVLVREGAELRCGYRQDGHLELLGEDWVWACRCGGGP